MLGRRTLSGNTNPARRPTPPPRHTPPPNTPHPTPPPQAGSLIVDALRTYRQPAFVYLPPGCELRGGAWVVIDSQINADMVEMYADPTAQASPACKRCAL